MGERPHIHARKAGKPFGFTALPRIGAAVVALVLLTTLGCATSGHVQIPIDSAPAMHFPQRGRSLSFAPLDHTAATAGPRWYDTRNDARLEVFAGYDAPRRSRVTTREYDRVHVYNGQVRNHSHGYTLRESIRETLRR